MNVLSSAASTAPTTSDKVDQTLMSNKELAAKALDAFFNKRDTSAVDKYVDTEFLEHNPELSDGPEELKTFINNFADNGRVEISAQAAEGDLVWNHCRFTGIPGHDVTIVVDIFRVKNGKLVEHWDVAQEEVSVTKTTSGRPMFPVTTSSTASVMSEEVLLANKKLVATALDGFFNKRDVTAVDKYIGSEYLQHNPTVGDGPDHLKDLIRSITFDMKYELGAQVADADLVWTQGRYSGIPGQNAKIIIDIFRVTDGKITEHWDISQDEVPAAQTVSGRPMFSITD